MELVWDLHAQLHTANPINMRSVTSVTTVKTSEVNLRLDCSLWFRSGEGGVGGVGEMAHW